MGEGWNKGGERLYGSIAEIDRRVVGQESFMFTSTKNIVSSKERLAGVIREPFGYEECMKKKQKGAFRGRRMRRMEEGDVLD